MLVKVSEPLATRRLPPAPLIVPPKLEARSSVLPTVKVLELRLTEPAPFKELKV